MSPSVLSRLRPDQIAFEPFPHLHSPQALEPAYYAELAGAYPSMQRIVGPGPLASHQVSGPLGSNRVFRMPACEVVGNRAIPAIWRDFFAYHCSDAFLREAIGFWRTAIEREHPDLEASFGRPLSELSAGVRCYQRGKPPENIPENLRADVMLDCQFVINTPVTTPSAVRGPHVDKPYKLFAALLYFRHPDDRSVGGNLILERIATRHCRFDRRQHIPEELAEPIAEIPYASNALIMWLNTPRSLHSASARSISSVPRRYVNLLAECYAVRPEGLFELERTLAGSVYWSVKRRIRRRAMRSTLSRT